MDLEKTVSSISELYEIRYDSRKKSRLLMSPIYAESWGSMCDSARKVVGNKAAAFLKTLYLKAPNDLEQLLPAALSNASQILSMGYDRQNVLYLACTISHHELERLEGNIETALMESGLYKGRNVERRIKNIAKRIVIKSTTGKKKPETCSDFIERCMDMAENYNKIYEFVKRSHPKQATVITDHSFHKPDPQQIAIQFMKDYDTLRTKYSADIAARSLFCSNRFEQAKNLHSQFQRLLQLYDNPEFSRYKDMIANVNYMKKAKEYESEAERTAQLIMQLLPKIQAQVALEGKDVSVSLLWRALESKDPERTLDIVIERRRQAFEHFSGVRIRRTLAQRAMLAPDGLDAAKEINQRYRRFVKQGKRNAAALATYTGNEDLEIIAAQRKMKEDKTKRQHSPKKIAQQPLVTVTAIIDKQEVDGYRRNGTWHFSDGRLVENAWEIKRFEDALEERSSVVLLKPLHAAGPLN